MKTRLDTSTLSLLLCALLLGIGCGTAANAQRSEQDDSSKEEVIVRQRASDFSAEARNIAEAIKSSGKYSDQARSFVRRALDGQPNAVRVKTWIVLIRAWEEDKAARADVEGTLLWMTDTSSSAVQASGHYFLLARLKGDLPQAAPGVTIDLGANDGERPNLQNAEFRAAISRLRTANDGERVALVSQMLGAAGDYHSLRSRVAKVLTEEGSEASKRAWLSFSKRCLERRFPDDRFEPIGS